MTLSCDVTFVNATATKLYDATWYLTMISDLWNCCKTSRRKHRIFFF